MPRCSNRRYSCFRWARASERMHTWEAVADVAAASHAHTRMCGFPFGEVREPIRVPDGYTLNRRGATPAHSHVCRFWHLSGWRPAPSYAIDKTAIVSLISLRHRAAIGHSSFATDAHVFRIYS